MTTTTTDLEIAEAINARPACEWEGDGWVECGKPASWLMSGTPCGHDDFFCDPCRIDALTVEQLDCDCGAEMDVTDIRWEPLR